ncbi:MAG: hypothetical protein COT81_00480 [Candidatus Buchananbacteria bacterium CG10_big_fil_rev_8_21_14_0_10_42_9]|uniref:AI-2E family transporter n=1 Tax=Candidatus Buchananbacteria bacterium CG10_big_fil_rev_8_21_14_0_10_42_9 TaxID=1974526 RepID=A0A2H0W2G8_9BACT|nr:MAG: hypothetical protein COT81_00480 [Candidatus Buchananbacteria bacterium CG10_big_fil_rev_8_21_14_0_10_42_9]
MEEEKRVVFDISFGAILKVLAVLLALGFLYLIRDIIAVLFVAVILAAVIEPFVIKLQMRKVPRALGVLVVYLIIFLIFSLALGLLVPPMAEQISSLTRSFPSYWDSISKTYFQFRESSLSNALLGEIQTGLRSVNQEVGQISTGISQLGRGIFSFVGSLFGGLVSFILILVITFYLVVEENNLGLVIRSVAPKNIQPYLFNLFRRMQDKIGAWLRGQIILSVIVGLLILVGLWITGHPYFLVLALLAAVFEFIPYLGPIMAAIPAIFLALLQDPLLAVWVLIVYIVVQQIENNFLVPQIMRKAVGLNPVMSIVAMLIGAKLWGVVGIILAIPVATAIAVLVQDFFEISKAKTKS